MTSLFSRLQKLNKELRPRWSVDWNAPVHVLASDGSGEHQATARNVETAEAIVECRNSLPAVLNLIEAAQHIEIVHELERDTTLSAADLTGRHEADCPGCRFSKALAVFVTPGGDRSTMSGQEAEPQEPT